MTDAWPGLLVAAAILIGFALVLGLVAFIAIRLLGKVNRHGSVAGALYDGRVGRTHGEIEGAPMGLARMRLKIVDVVHEPPGVGLEIHANAKLAYRMTAVRLTREEALRVADALEAVARR